MSLENYRYWSSENEGFVSQHLAGAMTKARHIERSETVLISVVQTHRRPDGPSTMTS